MNSFRKRVVFILLTAILMFACQPGAPATPGSLLQVLLSTPTFRADELPSAPLAPVPTRQIKSVDPLATRTPAPTTLQAPTRTLTPTFSPLPSVTPTSMPEINILIFSCDTGIDIFNRLGEVTNAYVRVQNLGEVDARGIQVVLEGSDEEKAHPDKKYQLNLLPAGYEIALKLTVDTQNGRETAIRVTVKSGADVLAFAIKDSCRSRRPDRDLLQRLGELFQVRKIQQ